MLKHKQLSSPFQSGGGGYRFESRVQSSYVVLMLTGGYSPCLPSFKISKIKLQGKIEGYETDDMIVHLRNDNIERDVKLIIQIKSTVKFTQKDSVFSEVINAAWKDFNNQKLFNKVYDKIALVTGPLSNADTKNVLWILNQARQRSTYEEFIRYIETPKFSPSKANEKLKAFKFQLKKANNDTDIDDEELFGFLKNFYVFDYDLSEEYGIVLSLIESHISQYNLNSHETWTKILEMVQDRNQHSGEISKDNLPACIVDDFNKKKFSQNISAGDTKILKENWRLHPHANDLLYANLIGAWNEKNDEDIQIIEKITKKEYGEWIKNIREIFQLDNSPLNFQNNIWKINNRKELWKDLGTRLFDDILDDYCECVKTVLKEKNPALDLDKDKRYAASLYGKELKYSQQIRRGFAEGLAILANNDNDFINCTLYYNTGIANKVVQYIFDDNWKIWASLDRLLPTLAEAAPNEYISIIEKCDDSVFVDLFDQESGGITGRTYISGLLWSLESLAWDNDYFLRSSILLGKLSTIDTGGNYNNRPVNSLISILLPWLPQTLASIPKRKILVNRICSDFPKIGWKLILSLLNNARSFTSGTHQPQWRDIIPLGWKPEDVNRLDYINQSQFYYYLAIEIAKDEIVKLASLVDLIERFSNPYRDKLFNILKSDSILLKPENERFELWLKLKMILIRQKRWSFKESYLGEDGLNKLSEIVEITAPKQLQLKYQILFDYSEYDLFENENKEEIEENRIKEERENAISQIIEDAGLSSIIEFIKKVKFPYYVGDTLANIRKPQYDTYLLPKYLDNDDNQINEFMRGYIWKSRSILDWNWIDQIDMSKWSENERCKFLLYLPPQNETWLMVEKWLENEALYWTRVRAVLIDTLDGKFKYAIDKLIKYDRPHSSISLLYKSIRKNPDKYFDECIIALKKGISTLEKHTNPDTHSIVRLIMILEKKKDINDNDLMEIEWGYLDLLVHYPNIYPSYIMHKIASDSEFFCQLIKTVYKSTKEKNDKENPKISESIVENAYSLLFHWQTPPGMQIKGVFDDNIFTTWLDKVITNCTNSGHLDIALDHIGKVLTFSPKDKSGLWINKTIAEALNKCDVSIMRKGFQTGLYNSRGVVQESINGLGNADKELAEEYRKKAEDLDVEGFDKLSQTIRQLADQYDHEAVRWPHLLDDLH